MSGSNFMRWRKLFLVSLGVNVLLGALWLTAVLRRRPAPNGLSDSLGPATVTKTNVLVRRQFFSWSEVEASEYPKYIANLRDIGCPEQTIRDIIIAEINSLYAKRLATELVTPEQQWWRTEPDTNVLRVASDTMRRLEDERRALLARLLGPNWESGDFVNLPRPSRPGVMLDGPVLGLLPAEVKQAVENISVRAQDRAQAYLEAQAGKGLEPDPIEFARLRQQMRLELAGVLTPQQLEEFLLRYSQNADDLRGELGQLTYFSATPDEFRAVFRATDSIGEQLELLGDNADANSVLARRNLEAQRESAIKLALGPERYKEFTMLHDPLYRDAFAAADEAGKPDAAQTIYENKLASAIQQAVVRANTNLTAPQRDIELKRLEWEQLKANAVAMGQDLPPEPAPETPPPPPPPPVSAHPYVLGLGDTVASVAVRYGISVKDLQSANPDVDFRKLKAGDAIRVPDALPMR